MPLALDATCALREMIDARRKGRYGLQTDALVLHCPGPLRRRSPTREEWQEAEQTFFTDSAMAHACRDDPNLTIVTVNTSGAASLLERCARHLGLRGLVVLGREQPDWRFDYKVVLLQEQLRSLRAAEHVLFVDAFDVLLLGCPRTIVDRFRQSGAEILFCSTAWDWPPSSACRDFENRVGSDVPRPHRHLNSGAYVGNTAYVLRCLDQIVAAIQERADWCQTRDGFDDQLAWRELHRRHHPAIRVDTQCSLFVRFDADR